MQSDSYGNDPKRRISYVICDTQVSNEREAAYAYQANNRGGTARLRSPPPEPGARHARLAGTVDDGAGHAWMGQGHGGQEQEQGQQHA